MSVPSRARRSRARGGVPTFAILLSALAVLGVMVFQAFRAEQDRRATADRALREYAGFAAWEFASNAKEEMWMAMTELLRPAEQLAPKNPGEELPSPAILVAQSRRVAGCNGCALEIPASYYFRLDLNDSALAHVLAEGAGARAPDLVERQWLRDTIVRHARDVFARHWRVATVVGQVHGRRLTIAYTVVRDTSGAVAAAYGVVSESNRFVAAISSRLADWDLLPPALTREAGDGHLVSIIVRDDNGHEVYRSPWQFPGRLSASYEQQKFVAGFTVVASLSPLAAQRLVLADSYRMPVLLVLLAITAALVGIAFRQLRREETLSRLRADFVSSASHELRTPLAQIRMFAELLRMGWIRSEEERVRSLDILDQEARRLGHLVDRVLCFDRTERGDAALRCETAPLAPLVREVVSAFRPLASARDVSIDLDLETGIIAKVDRGAIHQILVNLLDNAVKYGPSGQTIRVSLARTSADRASLRVADEGPGVPAGEEAHVWAPFRRLDRDANSSIAGSGIGLALVRRLAHAHGGGAAIVASSGNIGACFEIILPCLPPAAAAVSRTNVSTTLDIPVGAEVG